MPNHSCLFGLQTNNSNSDGYGLRQNCTRCLFLHSGVSIKFYWLLSKCRAASCYRSGLRLLQVAKLGSEGSKICGKQFSVNRQGSRTSRCQMSRCRSSHKRQIEGCCPEHFPQSGRPLLEEVMVVSVGTLTNCLY